MSKIWVAFSLLLWLGVQPLLGADAPARPNIIVILADDLGYSDIGCYGGEIPTPTIDRLAASGVRFTQFYNTARCCPTRASLLTGLYPHQAGTGHMVEDRGLPGYRGRLNDDCVTIAEVLKTAGYGTYMSGKWHVTRDIAPTGPKTAWPLQRGFDKFFGLLASVRSYYDPPTLTRDNEPIVADKGFYLTDAITTNALAYLDDAEKAKKPFFLYVAYTAPHWPLHAFEEDVARHREKYKAGWDKLRQQRFERMKILGIIPIDANLSERDPESEPWEDARHKTWQIERMAVYAAMVQRMDHGIGQIIDKLKEQKKLDDTLILFLADNGACAEPIPSTWSTDKFPTKTRDGAPVLVGNDPRTLPGPANVMQSYGLSWANLSNTPHREFKHFVHEGGISTPLIAHWPAAIALKGELRQQPGHLIDIMATCVDVAGAKYPAEREGMRVPPMEGKSLRPAFANKAIDRDALYWEHEGNRAIRKDNWKLVAKGAAAAWELYDLASDRIESVNLAAKHPDKVKLLAEAWETWARRAKVLPGIWGPMYTVTVEPKEKPDHSKVPGTAVAYAPASNKQYIGSPSLVRLPNGDYLASHDLFGPGSTKDQTRVYHAEFHGHTWSIRSKIDGQWWSSMFVHKGDLYIMGVSKEYGSCIIRKSTDSGRTWSTPKDKESGLLLDDGAYHCAPVPVIEANGRLWRAMEDAQGPGKWGHHFRAFMMSAPVDADLLKASSWTSSTRIGRNPDWLDQKFGGWLEGNAVLTPEGKIVDYLRVDVKQVPEKTAIVHISPDGKSADFDPKTGFVDFPGGSKKFAIRYDPSTRHYWTLANVVLPEFEKLPSPKVRNTLVLMRSSDLKKWEQRSVILKHPDAEKHGFQYVDWLFDGEDIVFLSRTAHDDGIGGAHNQHDANYLTFHRIKDFRVKRE